MELPVRSLVLIFAVGALVVIIGFILGKRQISRFASRSSRGPHTPIGEDAPKALRQEIDRRLRRVRDIKFEPKLITPEQRAQAPTFNHEGKIPHSYYRIRAVEDLHKLDEQMRRYDPNIVRRANQSLKGFLIDQSQSGPLKGMLPATITKFVELYEKARHEVEEFREVQYKEYSRLLEILCQHVSTKIDKGDNIKSFPFKIDNSVFYCPTEGDAGLDSIQVTHRPHGIGNRKGTSESASDNTDTVLLLPKKARV